MRVFTGTSVAIARLEMPLMYYVTLTSTLKIWPLESVSFMYGVRVSLLRTTLLLLLACAGKFNHKERCWLVIWEAEIVIELPPGVFLFYPSAIFYHWNADLAGVYCFTFP
jgi:hypothetical protein